MKPESRTTFIAPGGKEWVKGLALHVRGHAGPVIGEDDLDVVGPARPRRDRDRAGAAVGKGVVGGVEEEVGQDLTVGAGIAVQQQPLGHVDLERDRRALQDRTQAGDDLVGGFAE